MAKRRPKAIRSSQAVFALPTARVMADMVDEVERQAKSKTLVVPMLPIAQTDATIYSTTMTTAAVVSLFCRYPFMVESGDQPGLALSRVKSLRFRAMDESVFRVDPSNIVVSVKESAVKNGFIRKKNGRIKGMKYVALEIDLEKYKEALLAAEVDASGRLLFPEEVMLGFLVDGHHRIEASYENGSMEYAYPTAVYFDDEASHLIDVFEVINKKQKAPNEIMLHAMRELSKKTSKAEQNAAEVLTMLMNEQDSVFNGRIRLRGRLSGDTPDEQRKYATNDKMLTWLSNALTDIDVQLHGSPVAGLLPDKMYHVVNDYFTAVAKVFPRAWDNPNYVLTKAMGIDIMMCVFPDILKLYYVKAKKKDMERLPTEKDFETTLRRAFYTGSRPKTLSLCDRTHALNWTSRGFGALSGAKGTDQIKSGLRTMVFDEIEDAS